MKPALLAALLLLSAGCATGPAPAPRYVLGPAWQADGFWFYPAERHRGAETGLASVATRGGGLTANGEAYDPGAMAGAHQTLQLPAIVQVTNLETGAQAAIRLNDRGPRRPHRMLELTPRAAALLGVAAAGTPVRVEIMEAETRAAAEGLPGAPRLEIAAAPRAAVLAEALDGTSPRPRASLAAAEDAAPAQPRPQARLPETVTRVTPGPATLWLRLGEFGHAGYAEDRRRRLAALAPEVEMERTGRQIVYRLRAGPARSVAEADRMLDMALRAGVRDARIVAE